MKISGSKHPAISLEAPLVKQPLARRYLSLATASLLLFATVSVLVVTGLADAFDHAGHTLARDIQGPAWLTESARDITGLGSNLILVLLAIIGAGYALLIHRRAEAICLIAGPIGCLLVVALLKATVSRPRPALLQSAPTVFTTSFPSSHAALSACVFAIVALLLIHGRASRATFLIVVVAAATAGLVGLSRVYLGVHWPTDVLAGWSLGLGWAYLCLAGFVIWSTDRNSCVSQQHDDLRLAHHAKVGDCSSATPLDGGKRAAERSPKSPLHP